MWHFLRCRLGWMMSAACLLTCHCLVAQVSVAGTVVDPDGAAVPNASIMLKTPHGNVVNGGAAHADSVGHFRLLNIGPGDYQLEVASLYGFEPYQTLIQVKAGMHELRIQLTPPIIKQDVVVAQEGR